MSSSNNKNFILKNNIMVSSDFVKFEYIPFLQGRRVLSSNIMGYTKVESIALIFKLEFIDSLLTDSLIAMYFFFKYLFVQRPYFYPVKVMAGFKRKVYNCRCVLHLRKSSQLNFLLDFLGPVSKILSINDFFFEEKIMKTSTCDFTLFNLSLFRFVEVHPIFFKWKARLNVICKFKDLRQMESRYPGVISFLTLVRCRDNLIKL